MALAPVARRPGSPGIKLAEKINFLEVLPLELRLKVYEYFFADLISELSDNLFGVFALYDSLYDYTQASLESHVGKTGLTTLLYTCKQVHDEAIRVLCSEAEFVLNIMGDEDGDDKERDDFRLPEGNQLLKFARNLKVNLEPLSDATNGRLVRRIHRFLAIIDNGANLRTLKLRISGPNLTDSRTLDEILSALSTLRTRKRIEVAVGEVPEEILSDERLHRFVDAIDGIYLGRGQHPLEPNHYDGEDDDDDYYGTYESDMNLWI
ncbi:hypothetical protein F5Y08DRAFT_297542 [Xylaria arbuscula]|nr:hypothetical protein F5Y08DRAFT_297542 [Xylaria arbuscula]